MKKCTKCDMLKPLSEFSESKSEKGYKQYRCKSCNKAYRETRKDLIREYQLQYKFGVSLELYNKMMEEQGNSCKICKKGCVTGRKLAVDHDHKTGKVRGLLCSPCNRALGYVNDDLNILSEAITYLKNNQ